VVRLFAGDRIYKILDRLGPPEGEPIEHGMLTKRIEGAQRRVEEMHFESRKNVLKYDDVLNSQRERVYAERRLVLEGQDISELIREWIDETVWGVVDSHTSGAFAEEWDLEGMIVGLRAVYPVGFAVEDLGTGPEVNKDELLDRVAADAQEAYKRKETIVERIQPGLMRQAERFFLLQSVDHHWREHLDAMEYLRDGIHLRGLAQRDPLVEYRTEGHAMFQVMMREVEEEVVTHLFHVTFEVTGPDGQSTLVDAFASEDPLAGLVLEHEASSVLDEVRAGAGNGHAQGAVATEILPTPVEQRRVEHEIGRNDPCWCGSGKKYKRCHGAAGADAL
jgi:preprotein translocase subunit SecA